MRIEQRPNSLDLLGVVELVVIGNGPDRGQRAQKLFVEVTGLRDRALLGTLAYTFARIGAVVNLKVEDYYPSGKRFLLRFKEKGGKEKELPVHHKLEELLDQYLKASGLEKEPESPLFPASIGKTGKLSRRPLVRTDAADMLKRRLKQAGLPAHYGNGFEISRRAERLS